MTNRYLLMTWDGGGNVPPELGLARRLVARGHQVRVLGDPTLEAEARAAGCAFTPWTSAPHATGRGAADAVVKDWETSNPLKMMGTYLHEFLADPAHRWAADVDAELEARPVDAVLCDFALPAASIPVQARGIPIVGLMPNCWMLPTKGIPPFGPGFQPATNPATKARDAILRLVNTRLFDRALPRINEVRADFGLAPAGSTFEQMIRDRMLVLTTPGFDFTSPHLPTQVHYAGPVLDDPAWAEPWSAPWSPDDQRPLVLASLSSTFQDQVAVLNRIVAALAALPVRGLVTLGQSIDPALVPSRSGTGDVVVVPSAPHGAVIPQAAAVISHGGHGTTMKGLCAGVPIVCLPMGRDQNETAARLVHHGAGVRLKPTAPAEAIRAAVGRVLDEPDHRAGARRLAAAIATGSGCVDPIAELEAMVARRPVA